MNSDIKRKVKELKREIDKHNILYHQHDSPEISDIHYDSLLQEYSTLFDQLDSDDRLLEEFKLAYDVGAPASDKFFKIEHLQPMLSLQNCFSEGNLDEFIGRVRRFLRKDDITFFCEPKIDGLSFSLLYENGKLVRGATRGDGKIGEDITQNIMEITGIPWQIDFNCSNLEVRGEIYIAHNDFIMLNDGREKKGQACFANPRNAAAGSVRQLDSSITADRALQYFVYSIGHCDDSVTIGTHSELLCWLKQLGFRVNDLFKLCGSAQEVLEFYSSLSEMRSKIGYDIDGVVYKVNERILQERLGATTKYPRWAIAHKFPTERAKTQIEKITVQVGRTGALTPVAELKPVKVGGVLVGRVSLHNYIQIQEKDIREHDWVYIERAGDVIPHIVSVDLDLRPAESVAFVFPKFCPVCGSAITFDGSGSGAIVRCTGEFICKGQLIRKIKHFVSRDAFNIMGLGEKQIEFFWCKGLVKSIADVFRLEAILQLRSVNMTNFTSNLNAVGRNVGYNNRHGYKNNVKDCKQIGASLSSNVLDMHTKLDEVHGVNDTQGCSIIAENLNYGLGKTEMHDGAESGLEVFDLKSMDGWGDKSVENLCKSIHASRVVKLDVFIYSLGIRFIGKNISKVLAKAYTSYTNWYGNMVKCVTEQEYIEVLSNIDGIGDIMVESLQVYFSNKKNIQTIDEVAKYVTVEDVYDATEGILSGKKVVFTGGLSSMSRAEAKYKAELLGAKVMNSISNNVDFVIAGSDAGSKLNKAQGLELKIISEDDWIGIIDNV